MNPNGALKRSSNSQHKVHHHIKWDEPSLEKQAQQRGDYPKIPEPKTPYNEAANDSEEEKEVQQPPEDRELSEHLKEAHLNASRNQCAKVDLKTLNEQLMKEYEKQRLKDIGEQPVGDSDDEQHQKKHAQFLRKRAEHYSEYKKIQQARKNHELDDL